MIETRLNHTTEEYQQLSLDLREDDTINTMLEIEPLFEGIQKMGFFPSVPEPSKCLIEGTSLQVAIVNKEREMCVALKDETGKPVQGKCHFLYELRLMDEDPDKHIPPKVTVTQCNNGTARLGFTPDQLGEYEMTVMIRNKPIADPLKITAVQSRDYTDFPNMPVTYKNVGGGCRGVAVHNDNTIYATDYNNSTIRVFRPDGTESQIGSSHKNGGQLSFPWGIALIDDTIYVASHINHTIKMYSTNGGRFIRSFGGKGTSNANPTGICTDGKGRVLVADHYNKRIQVFTSQGKFINKIPCSTYPYDVSVDPVGNIHVALYNNNDIAVYSQNGQLIETYNLGGVLQGPTAIHIDNEGNRLIVGNDQVYITDPTGSLVATRQVNGAQ